MAVSGDCLYYLQFSLRQTPLRPDIKSPYYKAESASWRDEANPAFLSDDTRYLDTSLRCPLGISRVGPARKISPFVHAITPLLTNLVWSRWLDIDLVLFCLFIDLVVRLSKRKKNLS